MTLNCILCDDDPAILEETKKTLVHALSSEAVRLNISEYTDSRNFSFDLEEDMPVDLAILDIDMPFYNGLNMAHEIKKRFPDSVIIFLTAYIQYAAQSYELDIFRYLHKSELNVKLSNYILDAYNVLKERDKETLLVCRADICEQLPYRQIVYIRKQGKYVVIYCKNQRELKVRLPLFEVRKELDPDQFFAVDRGCVVNLAYVESFERDELLCKSGTRLPVSRSHQRQMKDKLLEYWGNRL